MKPYQQFVKQKALETVGANEEEFGNREYKLFEKILRYRKKAFGTAKILNLHLRLRSSWKNSDTKYQEMEEFFDALPFYTGQQSFPFTKAELAYFWQAWKPFVKNIQDRKHFVKILKWGCRVRGTISEIRCDAAKSTHVNVLNGNITHISDHRSESERRSFTGNNEYRIFYDLKLTCPERLYFIKAAAIWATSVIINKILLSDLKKKPGWTGIRWHITIDTGKVTYAQNS